MSSQSHRILDTVPSIARPATQSFVESPISDLAITEPIDILVTSPPYWKQRTYDVDDELGHESTPDKYIQRLVGGLNHLKQYFDAGRGLAMINIGDTYHQKSLCGIPGRLLSALEATGWVGIDRIIWQKSGNAGMPSPAQDRLAQTTESILLLAPTADHCPLDTTATTVRWPDDLGGNVWQFPPAQTNKSHLAVFPQELPERCLALGCPPVVCTKCGTAAQRVLKNSYKQELQTVINALWPTPQPTTLIDPSTRVQSAFETWLGASRPEIAARLIDGSPDTSSPASSQQTTLATFTSQQESDTPISTVTAADNDEQTNIQLVQSTLRQKLQTELTRRSRWRVCSCHAPFRRGRALDPFVGSGTTVDAGLANGYHVIGADADLPDDWAGTSSIDSFG